MSGSSRSMSGLRDLGSFGIAQNTLTKYLVAEDGAELLSGDKMKPRQVMKAHYTPVLPEPVPDPQFVAGSASCARMLGLQPSELATDRFTKAFAGNELLPGLDRPYATVYGCHCYGTWFGQLGDGRALSIGEVYVPPGTGQEEGTVGGTEDTSGAYGDRLFELQLKGCGRSPYSRGFDGRAVLRSSVREFLVSESMHHLGVSTTRALSIVTTGMEIRRPWYAASSRRNMYNEQLEAAGPGHRLPGKFSPDTLMREAGAVLCRVSRSFLRFGQLELFGLRGELANLRLLADYTCFREYPHLLTGGPDAPDSDSQVSPDSPDSFAAQTHAPGPPSRYVALFRSVARQNAELVAGWLRVGYVQGNMNSDNTLLGGRTIDYGPYGWMEKFDPYYQPFTSDTDGKFAFIRQPAAMAINVEVLGTSAFVPLVKHAYMEAVRAAQQEQEQGQGQGRRHGLPPLERYLEELEAISKSDFAEYFTTAYDEVKRRKLGFAIFDSDAEGDMDLWNDLEKLMYGSQADFTMTFRNLGKVAQEFAEEGAAASTSTASASLSAAMEGLAECFYDDVKLGGAEEEDAWLAWLARYRDRIQSTTSMSPQERRAMQDSANPKYVLRNWMAVLAYERAKEGDYSLINELTVVLERPYEEQPEAQKWFDKTPSWATNMPGVAFLS